MVVKRWITVTEEMRLLYMLGLSYDDSSASATKVSEVCVSRDSRRR